MYVLHHTAGNPNRPAREDWIDGKYWYNWIIDGKGKLHTFKTTRNKRSCDDTFDLAFSGNFANGKPTPAQIETWKQFKKTIGDDITTHKQLSTDHPGCATPSVCPGNLMKYIDIAVDHDDKRIEELKNQVRRLHKEVRDLTKQVHAAEKIIVEQDESEKDEIRKHKETVTRWKAEKAKRQEAERKSKILEKIKDLFR